MINQNPTLSHHHCSVTVIGLGLNPKEHISLQAIKKLKQADCILYFSNPETEELFECTSIKNTKCLDDLYKDGGIDDNNYSAILNKIKDQLLLYKDIVIALPGNPRLGVSICNMIQEAIKNDKNITFNIFPGISSFESMIIDADCDPLEHGAVLVDVNRLLLFNYPIQTFYDYFIFHICSIGTRETNVSNPQKNNHLTLLQKYLLQFYPAAQPCSFIKSIGNGIHSSKRFCTTVKEMHKAINFIDFTTSLYLPSTGYPPIENKKFLNLLMGTT